MMMAVGMTIFCCLTRDVDTTNKYERDWHIQDQCQLRPLADTHSEPVH